ncbi:MAG: lysine--tRNA ligase, partial [Candidatus Omnitrophica bacterium]|nr:lysine--tRNA ligase [Candidatus Omnitrophota bacterium]
MEVDEIKKVRLEKLHHWESRGIKPYGGKFKVTHSIREILDNFQEETEVVIAGRILANRKHGKVYFMDLEDQTGRMQLFLRSNNLEEQFDTIKDLDIGDIIGAKGQLFITKTGQQSLRVMEF